MAVRGPARVVVACSAALLTACGGDSGAAPVASSSYDVGPEPYRSDVDGLESRLFLPRDAQDPTAPVPVVVLVPGGSWTSADPAGLTPLADALAGSGSAVVTTTYRTEGDGASFPVPVSDVVCAIDDAVRRVAETGVLIGPVVVVGHSAGAQLAALAALAGGDYEQACPSPHVQVDGFVGLAGPYDVLDFSDIASALFGSSPEEDPDAWRAGNPMSQVSERPDLPVLLVHGEADDVVASGSSQEFGAALEAAGHPVTLLLLPDVDHQSVYRADAAAGPIEGFVADLLADAGREE